MSKPSALGSFFQNDATVMAKHQLRQDALGEGICLGRNIDDWACHCKDLFQCVGDMTEYDLAVLIAGSFIDITPGSESFGNFSISVEDLNLFAADKGIDDNLDRIQSITTLTNINPSKDTCITVLKEVSTACDPSKVTCSSPNIASFGVSTQHVCAAVKTPTKLLFEVVGDEFDGFVDANKWK